MNTNRAFAADLARYDAAFTKAGAIVTTTEGFAYIDESKVPAALVRGYRTLMSYGYANGLV